jgi:nucleoside-diphosphate-sugar epimerase
LRSYLRIGLFVAMETCAVLDAGGGIGNAVVRELAGRGLRVRAVSRDGRARVPDGVEASAADLTRPGGRPALVPTPRSSTTACSLPIPAGRKSSRR